VGKWHFYSGKGIKCQDLSQKKEVKRMNEINDKKRIEWIAEDLFAGSELVCISLRFTIPPELWEKFQRSDLYRELTGENIYLEDWNENINAEKMEKRKPHCTRCWYTGKENFDCGFNKCPGNHLKELFEGSEKKIKNFMEIEKNSIEDSKVYESEAYTYIDPDSHIGREIRYQSIALMSIESKNNEILRLLKRNGRMESPANIKK
jgi:hypothetical protein